MTLEEYERISSELDGMELYNFIKENWELAELSMKNQLELNAQSKCKVIERMNRSLYQYILCQVIKKTILFEEDDEKES